jgi:hypothetical protein
MSIVGSGRSRAGFLTACVLAAIVVAPVGTTAAAAVQAHAAVKHLITPAGRVTSSSTNWAGYAAFGKRTTFSTVRGRWVQPTATCTSGTQYASFWIGIDGYNSNSVEQIGTDADCISGTPVYYAWFEMYPAPAASVRGIGIRPGDRIVTRITAKNHRFTLVLTNATTGKSFKTRQKLLSAEESSAEWIAEAPCSGQPCTILPLADFGSVHFTGSYTTGNGHFGPIDDPAWRNDRIEMVTRGGTPKATTSALNDVGNAFEVDWQHV